MSIEFSKCFDVELDPVWQDVVKMVVIWREWIVKFQTLVKLLWRWQNGERGWTGHEDEEGPRGKIYVESSTDNGCCPASGRPTSMSQPSPRHTVSTVHTPPWICPALAQQPCPFFFSPSPWPCAWDLDLVLVCDGGPVAPGPSGKGDDDVGMCRADPRNGLFAIHTLSTL